MGIRYIKTDDRQKQIRELKRNAKQDKWLYPEYKEAKALLKQWFRWEDEQWKDHVIHERVVQYLGHQFEQWLRMLDAAQQNECRTNPPPRIMRLHVDPCRGSMFSAARGEVGQVKVMHFRIKLRLLAKTRRSPGEKIHVMYRWFVLNTSQMLKLMMAELRAQAIAGVFTTFAFRANMMGATKFVRGGPILARRRAKAALYRVGVRVRSAESPFQDFPRMRNWSVKNVRNWLGKNGFLKVKDPVVTQDGFTSSKGGSEIWIRQGRVGQGKIEAVRVDARGHKLPAKFRDMSYPQRLKDVKVAAGEPRHMHKELIESSDLAAYKNGGIQRDGKYWAPPSFDDGGQVATGDHARAHIWLTP